ncbi:transposase family protein [Actinacidiphila oryziradicis]|uniref:Transposase family protein n=1 Tax=Actinacidiphila oryziradicis TaxID=2571141 RepID=A0A4U0SRU6_9ACTN|nr:transposase family protein [Actinacidiphila oryziradicis]
MLSADEPPLNDLNDEQIRRRDQRQRTRHRAPESLCRRVLLDRLARVPDRRDPRGVRYRLAAPLAIGVCALASAGHNSHTAVAEWARRCSPQELRRLGCPFNPLTGRYRVPDEGTLREAYAKVAPVALTAAGYGRLAALTRPEPTRLTPDVVPEREQRLAHCAAIADPSPKPRRTAVAVDGKCLRGARRPDGSQVFVLSAVRHSDAVTIATREIRTKTNEIPEYLVDQRGAHYLLTVKNNGRPWPASSSGCIKHGQEQQRPLECHRGSSLGRHPGPRRPHPHGHGSGARR